MFRSQECCCLFSQVVVFHEVIRLQQMHPDSTFSDILGIAYRISTWWSRLHSHQFLSLPVPPVAEPLVHICLALNTQFSVCLDWTAEGHARRTLWKL